MTANVNCGHSNGTAEMQKMCISIVPIFNHLEQAEMNEIVKHTHSVSYPRGHTIYHEGDTSDGLYIIHKGRVKIYRLSENGKEQLVRILESGDFTGELSLFNETVHDAYAEAMGKVELCVMSRDDFQKFLLKYPAISLKVLGEFSNRLAKTEKQAARIAMETTDSRLAMYLADLAEERNSDRINLPMTRKDLASHIGTSPETISRKLAEFEDAGWIRQLGQREIEILDMDALLLI
ncbi:Crp/Fnr family transcriptional regulator [Sporosarcina sp. Sa2YVA2]|uniref:Crp/Fnr family transcriptional regulator n=1 Tax=Sporosarcina quadrami TaxID=2762234 RepID=A0ABR8U8K5_9BACL|nr:Crp/Fnr family transcriptional regulator [Sporosarcina quadrami]MBD7983834.1 Crp/Fnr family transcriptional regulator [Sporosarcina quadrami]